MKKNDIRNALYINGKACTSKEDLFEHFSKKLNFPDYFSNNWDSFEEIVNDLEIEHKLIIIYNDDALLAKQSDEKSVLWEILTSVNQNQNYQFYTLNKL